jgi:hypothetical protein
VRERKQVQNIIKVIAAVVDESVIALYKEDGSFIRIPQGYPRLAAIMKEITPKLAAGEVAEVDLGTNMNTENTYKEVETLSGKAIRFFRVAKSAISSLFNPTLIPPQTLGEIQSAPSLVPSLNQEEKLTSAVDEIMRNAKSVDHPSFHDKDIREDTIVAVTQDKKVIPDVHMLKPQLKHAVKVNSTEGMQRFLERCGAVATKRLHSVEDIMKFLEKADLPIADDGSIIAYKALQMTSNEGEYVDNYTQNVKQRVGSYVCMDPNMVDPNRSHECSHGLHIASRSHLTSHYYGQALMLTKIRPEDVIAVPHGDPSKIRVAGYHILARLSDAAYDRVISQKAFTDNEEAQKLLGRALIGDFPSPIEEVKITRPKGTGIKVTALLEPPTVEHAKLNPEEVKLAIALPEESSGPVLDAPKVNPKAVVQHVADAKKVIESRVNKAQRLYTDLKKCRTKVDQKATAQALLDHKKSTKLGWVALRLSVNVGEELRKILNLH